jgi:hypothetical protein
LCSYFDLNIYITLTFNIKIKDTESEIENVDMNKLLMQQQENQEKLALEMLKSVEVIKNNSLAAKQIIVKDNKVIYF